MSTFRPEQLRQPLNLSGSFTGSLQGTASTSSYYKETDPIFTTKSASLATTGSNNFNGTQTITGSLKILGSDDYATPIVEFTNNSTNRIQILITDETLSGYDAPIGSIGNNNEGLHLKYGNSTPEWGKFIYQDINNNNVIITGSLSITGSLALNNVSLEPTVIDDINFDILRADYIISKWGIYRITVADGTNLYIIQLPRPLLFPGKEITIINSDNSHSNSIQGGEPAYKPNGEDTYSIINPNSIMILKSIGDKWIGGYLSLS